ncbi:hypothetical protein H4R99_002491 [Coemansia sp. RSA 1722]|nr:hypothetical protein LPJ57_002378 [Coemansia sp. RSA 486]KAJ2237719.1 hypothetical protein IWW45_000725 [Coemansia sp. RSA 485]KAJ2603014.1 hypothetical protein H4R99_002491 [Coemansia sp. RSA 1722]
MHMHMTGTKQTACMWAAMGALLLLGVAAVPMREPDSLEFPTLGSSSHIEEGIASRVSERIAVPESEMAPAFTGMMPDELSSWMEQKTVREAEAEKDGEQESDADLATQELFEFTGMMPEQMSSWIEQQRTAIREAPSDDPDAASVSELEESIAESIAELQTAEFISDIVVVLESAEEMQTAGQV